MAFTTSVNITLPNTHKKVEKQFMIRTMCFFCHFLTINTYNRVSDKAKEDKRSLGGTSTQISQPSNYSNLLSHDHLKKEENSTKEKEVND